MRGIRLAVAVAVFAAAAVFAASGRWPWPRLAEQPAVAPAEVLPAVPAEPEYLETADTLRRGETLSELFDRHGVRGIDVRALAPALDPRRLRAGLVFNFRRLPADSEPLSISVRATPETRVHFRRAADGWGAEEEAIRWSPEVFRIEGGIDQSLYEALDQQIADADLRPAERIRLAWAIADIYAWQVDFTRDIRPGDRFQVLIERLISDEGEVRFGRVLAADLTMSGRQYTAFRFTEPDGRAAFYDAEGNSLRRAFLRTPVEFRRISSNFSRARRHPILGRVRRHEGTDYAADHGTPVMAAGDGVVIRAGRAGGYGNLVELRHRNGITTRYGHLSRFARGVRAGARVRQGQVIAYVGATGLASGPHLHYEFRIKGVAYDSRRVDLGHGDPLRADQRDEFTSERTRLEQLLYPGTPAFIAQADGASGDAPAVN